MKNLYNIHIPKTCLNPIHIVFSMLSYWYSLHVDYVSFLFCSVVFLSQMFFLLFHFNMFNVYALILPSYWNVYASRQRMFVLLLLFLFSLYNLFSTGQFNSVTAAKQTEKNKQNLTYVHKKGIKYENYHFISWMCFHFNFSFRCVECAFYRAVCTVSFRSSYEWWKNVTLVSYSNDMKWNVTRIKKEQQYTKTTAATTAAKMTAAATLKYNAYV